MKFLEPGRDWRKLNNWTILGMIIIIAMSIYSYMIINGTVSATPTTKAIILVVFSILVNLLDINMFRTILHIRKRKDAVKFLVFAAINVIIFQVVFEVIGANTEFLWGSVICSIMYNISFCYLFIVWFKLFDFVHEGLHEGLEGESIRTVFNRESDRIENK